MLRKLALVGIFLGTTLLFWEAIADAQVGLSPLVLELKAERGQALGLITVYNTTQAAFRARIYTSPFTYSRDKGFQTLSTIPNDLNPYLQFSPRELVVPPGTDRRVRLIVRFPPSLPDGEYRTALFTESLEKTNSTDSKGFTTTIATRVATTLYVRKGNVVPILSADGISINARRNQLFLLIHNAGLATARPSISWSLNQGNTVVQKGEVGASTVISTSERNLALNQVMQSSPLTAEKNNQRSSFSLTPGQYQLIGNLTWEVDDKQQTLPFNIPLNIPSSPATPSQ